MFVTVLLASTLGKIFQPFFDAMAWGIAAFYALIPNYAIAIALLTVAVMAVTAPLTIKSSRSMMAMSRLQPQMKELQKKYKGDKVRLNEEMMKLYRENNVSPAAGCVPMLIQFPVFIVLYDTIQGLTNTVARGKPLTSGVKCLQRVCAEPRYVGHKTAIYHNLVQHPGVMNAFGVNLADDAFSHGLSTAGRAPFIVMILIAVGLQYFQMHQMNKRNAAAGTVNQQMQTMTKIMPLIFIVIYIRIAAGVNVYFIVSNLARIGLQMWSFRTMPAQDEVRVGRLGAPAEGRRKRKTLMERLAEAQQRALEQQAQQRGASGTASRPALGNGRSPGGGAPGGDRERGTARSPGGTKGSGGAARSRPGGSAKAAGGPNAGGMGKTPRGAKASDGPKGSAPASTGRPDRPGSGKGRTNGAPPGGNGKVAENGQAARRATAPGSGRAGGDVGRRPQNGARPRPAGPSRGSRAPRDTGGADQAPADENGN